MTRRRTTHDAPIARRPWRARTLLACAAALACISGCTITPEPSYADGPEGAAKRLRDGYRLTTDAEKAAARGSDDEAIRLYREALSVAPEMAAAWTNLGVLYYERGEFPAAVECFQRGASLAPSDPRPLANVGVIYQRNGYAEDALRHFADALRRDPNYLDALRGGVRAAATLERRDQRTLEWAERGLMLERDARWREIFERERIKTEATLKRAPRGF